MNATKQNATKQNATKQIATKQNATNQNATKINNNNIKQCYELITPKKLKVNMPIDETTREFIVNTRNIVADIIQKRDKRKLFIVGPCSIHNTDEAKDYAHKLKEIADKVKHKILIVMRVYFEKPRTTIGWKGLINDPDLNQTYDVNKGITKARELLLYINKLNLPCGCEILDSITPQYICDLMSWGAIGARTTESQVHRQLVSGLSMPIGFKNGTGGTIKMAADAIVSASCSHCFMGVTDEGTPAIYETRGNSDTHIILRGGANGPNYDSANIKKTIDILRAVNSGNNPSIMVDCSHDNSRKIHRNQELVLNNVIEQITEKTHNNDPIIGVMIESNLNEGSQKLTNSNYNCLLPGVSITDGCINIETTTKIILTAYNNIVI